MGGPPASEAASGEAARRSADFGLGRRVLVLTATGLVLATALAGVSAAGPRASSSGSSPYSLSAVCGDRVPVPSLYFLRLRNGTGAARRYRWNDVATGQSGGGRARAKSETYIAVQDAKASHRIRLRIAGRGLAVTTGTRICRGRLVATNQVTGPEPDGARYHVRISGDSGYEKTFLWTAGGKVTARVPGGITEGSASIGRIPGGYRYSISHLDGHGADVTVAPQQVTVKASQTKTSRVTNRFGPFPPGLSRPLFTNPIAPPLTGGGAPLSRPGSADLVLAHSTGPRAAKVGDVVTVGMVVQNLGPATAGSVVAREVPPPNRVHEAARVLSIESNQGLCKHNSPVNCEFGSVPPGGEAILTLRVRPTVLGLLQSLATVSAETFDPNLSNNTQQTGLSLRPGPGRVGLRVRADRRRVAPGRTVGFEVRVRSLGPYPAVGVKICDRVPPALEITATDAPSATRRRACWTLPALDPGGERRFRLSARVRGQTGGSLTNTVRASGYNFSRAAARARVGVPSR